MVDKKQVENYIFYSLMMISLVIFIVIPSHASTQFDYHLNDFVDKYLLGNGYYSPSGYPFTSKVLNSFSVALAIIAGVFIGIWRKNDFDIEKMSKYAWPTLLIFVVSGLFTFFLSLNPQEFRESTLRRSFGTSESFHNNPVLFLAMMIGKQMWIYLSIRFSLSFLLCKLSKMKK